jgi:hypothetical protein
MHQSIVYGAGAFEMAASLDLMKFKSQVYHFSWNGIDYRADFQSSVGLSVLL